MRTFPFGDSPVTVQIAEYGAGDPVLILPGGAGPTSVDAFARRLADELGVRVSVPTHPGLAGTGRQPGVDSIPDLAALYEALLDDVDEVLVIGNSIGGWIAVELAAGGRRESIGSSWSTRSASRSRPTQPWATACPEPTGHLPQLESPDALLDLVREFVPKP